MKMNRRSATIILFVVAAVATSWWWFLVPAPEPAIHQPSVAPRPTLVIEPAKQELGTGAQVGNQRPGGPTVISDPRWNERQDRLRLEPDFEWKRPIDFYGRVIDERERPVAGARIEAQWSDLSAGGATRTETLSDQDGYFAITGKTGRGITIRVSKLGYDTPKLQRSSFDYAAFWESNYHEAKAGSAVLFHLRKRNEGAPLLMGEVRSTNPANGAPVRFDLLEDGRVSNKGQLEIAAITNAEKYPPKVSDWSAKLSVLAGGLIESKSEFPFEAPEAGYQSSVEFNMRMGAPDWKRTVEKAFYVRFGSPPKYGHIKVRINGSSQIVVVNYSVNPTGSRNLEPSDSQPGSSK
jgi:hypothetical protein